MLEDQQYVAMTPDDGGQKYEVLVEKHPLITSAHRGDLIRVFGYMEDNHDIVSIKTQ